jgi:YidC/Oxa1 family membrane protein insertase
MNILSLLFNEVIYRPLFNGLIFLYNVLPGHDFGIAIIVLTVVIRIILYPLNQKAIKSQKEMQLIQPKVKEVQQKYKNNKEEQGKALMDLYKEHKINPASGCLPILVQLPILWGLFSVLRAGLKPESLVNLYSFIAHPVVINNIFLGILDLSQKSIVLAILAGIAQFIQSKMLMPKTNASQGSDFSSVMNKQMVYFFPIFTVFIAASLPAGLGLYWVATTVFGIGQQYFVLKKKNGQQ